MAKSPAANSSSAKATNATPRHTTSAEQVFVVSESEDGAHLDKLVAHHAGLSRREARLRIAQGLVTVNRRPVRILTRPISAGARVVVAVGLGVDSSAAEVVSRHETRSSALATTAEASPDASRVTTGVKSRTPAVRILHLDKWMVVVDKPAQLLSEGGPAGGPSLETVVPELLKSRGERAERVRVWLVHRLDAGTSGVIVLARTPAAARALSETFRLGRARKCYLALCSGLIKEPRTIDAPIARVQGTRHGVRPGGKPAVTRVEPVSCGVDATLVRALPATGRTHQIRVHLASAGHPLYGDRLYGGLGYTSESPPRAIGRPMLHAQKLEIPHPHTGEPVIVETPAPVDFQQLARVLGISM